MRFLKVVIALVLSSLRLRRKFVSEEGSGLKIEEDRE